MWDSKRDLIERWWNGQYGRLVRRDARLYHQQRWTVELARGGADGGNPKLFHFASEEDARAFLAQCLEVSRGDWRKLAG